MKFTELKSSLESGAAPIYLLEGDDAYFRKKGEDMIKEKFLQMPELNFTSFDGESLKGNNLTSLVSAVKNFPFMAEKRIIKVVGFYPAESEFEVHLKPLFEDFPPTSILIIVNDGAKKGVDLKRKGAVTFVDCNRADAETVSKWVYITLRRAGISAAAEVCDNIAAYCLCNMARVSVEVEKLIAYKGGGNLTSAEVDELVFKDADFRLYELTNTVSRRDYTAFCTICDELLKKGGDELFILNGLFNYFKNLHTIITSDKTNAELASMLKMKEYGVKKSREQAERIGEGALAKLVRFTFSAASDVKSGKITPQGALQNVQNAIFFGRN